MKIEIEDIISGSLALLSIAIWYLLLQYSKSPLLSIIFLWSSMILISGLYVIVYNKKQRDKKLLRKRFLASGIPIYPTMIYYIYMIVFNGGLPTNQRLLPLFVLLPSLFLNGVILFFYDIRKKNWYSL